MSAIDKIMALVADVISDAEFDLRGCGVENPRIEYDDDAIREALSAAFDQFEGGDWTYHIGDKVKKRSGSWWEGIVVGRYSTEQTPRGYCVQLEKPNGPVQIYPDSALEICE